MHDKLFVCASPLISCERSSVLSAHSQLGWLYLICLVNWCVTELLCPQMRNKSLTNQKAYNPPPKPFNTCLSRAIILPPLKPLQVINKRLFLLFQLHANAANIRAKEEKDQFCKRKWLVLCLNSSACDTNTRPVQKLCLSANGTLLLHPSDLGYIAQMQINMQDTFWLVASCNRGRDLYTRNRHSASWPHAAWKP